MGSNTNPITRLTIGSKDEGLVSMQFCDPLEYKQITIPCNSYNSIDSICDGINFTLDNMRSFAGERANFNFECDTIRQRIPALKKQFSLIEININDDRGRLVNFE